MDKAILGKMIKKGFCSDTGIVLSGIILNISNSQILVNSLIKCQFFLKKYRLWLSQENGDQKALCVSNLHFTLHYCINLKEKMWTNRSPGKKAAACCKVKATGIFLQIPANHRDAIAFYTTPFTEVKGKKHNLSL